MNWRAIFGSPSGTDIGRLGKSSRASLDRTAEGGCPYTNLQHSNLCCLMVMIYIGFIPWDETGRYEIIIPKGIWQ